MQICRVHEANGFNSNIEAITSTTHTTHTSYTYIHMYTNLNSNADLPFTGLCVFTFSLCC